MIESVTKTLDWFGIKKCIDKWAIRRILLSYEKEIEKHLNDYKCNYTCHHWLAARGEVILNNDVYFNQGIRNIIINWKDKINEKIKNNEKVEEGWYKEELKKLKDIVINIRKGLGFCEEVSYTIFLAIVVFIILIVLYIEFIPKNS